MRVTRPQLTESEDGGVFRRELVEILQEHADAINLNANSADFVADAASLPDPAESRGRFYLTLDTLDLRFSDGATWLTVTAV